MLTRFVRCAAAAAVVAGILISANAVRSPASADPAHGAGGADVQSAPDEQTAHLTAIQFGHDVTVESETTETEQATAHADGTFSLDAAVEPVRVRAGNGWRPLDLELSTTADGLAPQASAVPVMFSDGGTDVIARIQAASGQWLTETWPGGTLPAPSVSGDTATYSEVYPGVDLAVTATRTGLAEVLVVKDARAAADPGLHDIEFGIDDGGLSTAEVAGGAAVARAPDGSAQLTSASPTWWDSSSAGAGIAGPGPTGVPIPLAHTVTSTGIGVDAAQAGLTDGVTFPVYVDPPFSGSRVNWTFVDSTYPSTSYWNGAGASDAYAHVGFINAANSDDGHDHLTRSFWQMDVGWLAGRHIDDAQFNTYEVYSSSCTARTVELWTSSAPNSSSTWNSQPTPAALSDSANVAYGYSPSCPAHAVGFDATAATQRAADAGVSLINLELRATSAQESDWLSWKKFQSNPVLHADYRTVPTPAAYNRNVQPCALVCAGTWYTASKRPTVSAQALEGDGGNLTYTFQICVGNAAQGLGGCVAGGTDVKAASASASTSSSYLASYSPTADLAPQDYGYRAYACESGTSVCGDWSGWIWFNVDPSPPPAPILTLPTPPAPGGAQTADNALSTSTESRFGIVGVTRETVTMSGTAAPHYLGYGWSVQPAASTFAFPQNLACASTAKGFHAVCGSTVGGSPSGSVTFTAPSDNATLEVVAFSAAGVASDPGTTARSFYLSMGDYGAMNAGHSWLTDSASGSLISDSASTTAATATLSGAGATIATDSSAPSGSPNTVDFSGNTVLALNQASGPSFAQTSSPVVDTAHSFSVGAWLYPTRTGTGSYQTAVAEDGQNASMFFLQNSGGYWRFCLSASDSAAFSGSCATGGTVAINQWTYVVGVYDATDGLLMLYANNSNTSGTPSVESMAPPAGTETRVVFGRDKLGSQYRYWDGRILDPFVIQAVVDNRSIAKLGGMAPPSSLTPPVIGS